MKPDIYSAENPADGTRMNVRQLAELIGTSLKNARTRMQKFNSGECTWDEMTRGKWGRLFLLRGEKRRAAVRRDELVETEKALNTEEEIEALKKIRGATELERRFFGEEKTAQRKTNPKKTSGTWNREHAGEKLGFYYKKIQNSPGAPCPVTGGRTTLMTIEGFASVCDARRAWPGDFHGRCNRCGGKRRNWPRELRIVTNRRASGDTETRQYPTHGGTK